MVSMGKTEKKVMNQAKEISRTNLKRTTLGSIPKMIQKISKKNPKAHSANSSAKSRSKEESNAQKE